MNQPATRKLGESAYLASGRQAEDSYVQEALCHVPRIARRYLGHGSTLDELVAAGNLGLVEASLRYDSERGVKFTSYANWWIRKAIIDSLGQHSGPIRLPRYQYDKLKQLHDSRASWFAVHGQDPSTQELASAASLSIREVHRLLALVSHTVSLDQPLSSGDPRPIKDTIEDSRCETPYHACLRQDQAERLRELFADLEIRDRQVLSLRFGLDDEVPLTLREASCRLGICRERVRQIEIRAMARLRERI